MIHTIDQLYNTTSISVVNTAPLEDLIEICKTTLDHFEYEDELDIRLGYLLGEMEDCINRL
jgi:transcription initiation factor IIE alpha subunit